MHALMTPKSCAVGMRNAILRNHLKPSFSHKKIVVFLYSLEMILIFLENVSLKFLKKCWHNVQKPTPPPLSRTLSHNNKLSKNVIPQLFCGNSDFFVMNLNRDNKNKINSK